MSIYYMKESQQPAQVCIIWLHGLGANAADMVSLVDQLKTTGLALRHVFIDAPARPITLNGGMIMPAWYDIVGMELTDREDKAGIEQSEVLIRQVIEAQYNEGLAPCQIILAGFSQGAAMAMYTALHTQGRLAGVIALSGYLPLTTEMNPILDKQTPFFMGSGQFDTIVFPKWTKKSHDWLLAKGYESLSYHQYPMEHSICFEEIKDISLWINRQIQGVLQ